jgi:hypothetical protein
MMPVKGKTSFYEYQTCVWTNVLPFYFVTIYLQQRNSWELLFFLLMILYTSFSLRVDLLVFYELYLSVYFVLINKCDNNEPS